jgi:hypothetical protein
VRLEVLTAELLNVEDGTMLTLFRLVNSFRRLEVPQCLHLQSQAAEIGLLQAEGKRAALSKHRDSLHNNTAQYLRRLSY